MDQELTCPSYEAGSNYVANCFICGLGGPWPLLKGFFFSVTVCQGVCCVFAEAITFY